MIFKDSYRRERRKDVWKEGGFRGGHNVYRREKGRMLGRQEGEGLEAGWGGGSGCCLKKRKRKDVRK